MLPTSSIRKTFFIDELEGDYRINLGLVDDMEFTYINGVFIDGTMGSESFLEKRNFKRESPIDMSMIGSHVTISHNHSWRICKALMNPKYGKEIIVDFRPERFIRIAITPLYSTFYEIYYLVNRLIEIIDSKEYDNHDNSRDLVT